MNPNTSNVVFMDSVEADIQWFRMMLNMAIRAKDWNAAYSLSKDLYYMEAKSGQLVIHNWIPVEIM